MPDRDDILYAAKQTRIALAPRRRLETFGQTSLHYYVLSSLLDSVNQVRIRQGKIQAERPKVITPRFFVSQALENFGEEARQYAEYVLSGVEGLRILEYGLRFRKEEYGEQIVHGAVDDIAAQIAKDAEKDSDELCGVIIGVDDLWEVSLFKFTADVVRDSVPKNVQEMAGRGLLAASSGNVPNAVRIELECDFRGAAGHRDRIKVLGEKLRRYGLFQEYEDRFYGLVRSL